MRARLAIRILVTSLFLAAVIHAAQAPLPAFLMAASLAPAPAAARTDSTAQAPSADEVRALGQRLVVNQHRDDDVLDEYERLEHYVDRTSAAKSATTEDRTYRVVPTGGGTLKILLKDGDKPVDPAEYRRQLQLWESILEMMARNDSRAKTAAEKYAKRKRERAQFVDAAGSAYVSTWVARETRNGRSCDVFELRPDPNFHPRSMFQAALAHVSAKLWVDHDAAQIVRGEAYVNSDISFGGGVLGKLYRGGIVSMEQSEIAPAIWLPTRYEYDFSGRKFLFPFEQHQTIEASHYRRIGSPDDALTLARDELAAGKPFGYDP